MSNLAIFILAVVLSVELCGRLLGLRDVWLVRDARPGALQRLIAPTLVLGLMVWWAAPEHVSALLSGFFAAGPGPDAALLRDLMPHALITGAFAPPIVRLVDRISSWLGEADPGRSVLLPPRSRTT